MAAKALTMETLNPNLLRLEYDVRGPLVVRAAQIERELQKGAKKPFSKVIKANLGDAHAMGQPPITFIREVLTRENIEMVIKFARRHKMLILADEVYQENIYDEDRPFHSFKKVLMEMGGEYAREQELASFMSVSKGYAGECGLRGGWVELVNLEPAVQAQLYKSITATLCPSTLGQVAVDCVAQPPWPGSASHARWAAERRGARGALRRRAAAVVSAFNNLPGFHCNAVKGALYAFPRFELPPRALEAARQAGQPPDVFYALQLLEETGVCVIAGSGFGQRAGTYHFRTSLVPPLPVLEDMLARLRRFHLAFLQRYAGEDGEVRWIGNGSN